VVILAAPDDPVALVWNGLDIGVGQRFPAIGLAGDGQQALNQFYSSTQLTGAMMVSPSFG
jgi:hypothetical protein